MSGTPIIRISEHLRYSHTPDAPTAPMSISHARTHGPPPALPPPRHIPEIAAGLDPGWQWGNDPNGTDFGRPAYVKPGSSLLGGGRWKDYRQERDAGLSHDTADAGHIRRNSSMSTVTADRDVDMTDDHDVVMGEDTSASRPLSNHRLQGERPLEQRTLEASSNTYDKQLLSRIGGPNGPPTPKRQSNSYSSTSTAEAATTGLAEGEQYSTSITSNSTTNGQLRPLTLPERPQQASHESPASSPWPSSGVVSPGFIGFLPEHGPPDTSRTQTRHGSLTFDDSVSRRGSAYDQAVFASDDFMDDGRINTLNLQDRSPGSSDGAKPGTKRRASSPPREPSREDRLSISSASGQSEIFPRRPGQPQAYPNRSSPVSRYHPAQSSFSSASSFGPRHNSVGSSLGMSSVPSSATSYGSGRLSPNALSPAFDPESKLATPYGSTVAKSVNPNPAPSYQQHHRTLSESSQSSVPSSHPAGISHTLNGSMGQVPGLFICECCPKKPKKFKTEEDLRAHESEKQYTCAYCPNRFKNKNEAERHQNSLHLRRHSWSCAALAGVEAAYHVSPSGNGTDVCGYCGDEFPNPPQWDVRAEHLNNVHKFGECNHAKKFFRADHFRQHLKHSHAGTSGKWTNMLENACMKDEPLPEKRGSSGVSATAPASQTAGQPLMVSTTALPGMHPGGRREILKETPHDS